MNKFAITTAVALLCAGALNAAAAGVIQTKDGRSQKAHDIEAETVSGIIWEAQKDRPGVNVRLWDLDDVRYVGQAMDEYNGLSRKLAGGRSDRLMSDAKTYLSGDKPSGWDDAQWKRIQLSCKYYIAMGEYLKGDYAAAIDGLEDYIKEAEKPENLYDKGIVQRVTFKSQISGKAVSNGGGLNRFYLDALETLGLAYMKKGDGKSANDKAFKTLQDLSDVLSSNSSSIEYYDWGIRALRASARYAEDQKDYKSAEQAYKTLQAVALKKNGGKSSHASNEALLKQGFMQIRGGRPRDARGQFYTVLHNWDNSRKSPRGPRTGWIDPEVAYLTAGSYVGMGLVGAASAKTDADWADVLQNFSASLALFNADKEIRSMALLGAANASTQLAQLNKSDAAQAATYATLASKYLNELTTLLPKTKAADDESIPDIQKIINQYKGD